MFENDGSATMPLIGDPTATPRLIVGSEHVRTAGEDDAVADVQAQMVVEPGNEDEVASVLSWANSSGAAVAPRGGGTKLSWGNPPARVDLIVSTTRLNRIVEHAWSDLTVSVEAGCTIQKLQEALAGHGQRLALDALWPERATIGGVLSTNDSGSLRLRFGSLRDLIIGVTIALSDGTLATSGGKVVKNVAGYDLPKLATGSLGTLGIITRAIFRVHPLPRFTQTLSVTARGFAEMQQFLRAVQDSKLAHTSLQIRCSEERLTQCDIALEGTKEGVAAQLTHLRNLVQSIKEIDGEVWGERERLWAHAKTAAIVKISVLPQEIAQTMEALRRIASAHNQQWKAILQPTGLGWLRLDGNVEDAHASLQELRSILELGGGSLVVLHQPSHSSRLEAWGASGDKRGLMLAIKKQFDPKRTLNPGRFVGGI